MSCRRKVKKSTDHEVVSISFLIDVRDACRYLYYLAKGKLPT